jgi:hypothetical protein
LEGEKVMKAVLLGLIALVVIPLGVYSQADRNTQPHEIIRRPVIGNPITSKDGIPLVEIIEATCEATPRRLESYSCQVRNSSDREITALAVVWTLTWSTGHSESSHDEYQSRDPFILEGRGIPPGEVIAFESSGPTWTEGNDFIKRVQVSIDYVEFADKSTFGPDRSKSSQRIAFTRLGASTYKNWLLHLYQDQGPDAVIRNLMSDQLVYDPSLGSNTSKTYQHFTRSGAEMYKGWLARVYKKDGFDAVIEKLSKAATKQPN